MLASRQLFPLKLHACKFQRIKLHLSYPVILIKNHRQYTSSSSSSSSLSSFTSASANITNKNLIYVGPVNQMVSRMKTFSIGSALVSTAFAPALIYFSAGHWSLFAKIGLVSSGKLCNC